MAPTQIKDANNEAPKKKTLSSFSIERLLKKPEMKKTHSNTKILPYEQSAQLATTYERDRRAVSEEGTRATVCDEYYSQLPIPWLFNHIRMMPIFEVREDMEVDPPATEAAAKLEIGGISTAPTDNLNPSQKEAQSAVVVGKDAPEVDAVVAAAAAAAAAAKKARVVTFIEPPSCFYAYDPEEPDFPGWVADVEPSPSEAMIQPQPDHDSYMSDEDDYY